MSVDGASILLVLEGDDDDREYVEEDLQYLIAELRNLHLDQIERVSEGPPPPGTRATGGVELGALLVAVGGSGATLPMLIGLVQDWLARRRSGTIRLKIGSDELELTGASDAMRQRALEDFLRRHTDG
ncbi:effector-associated constant component EACC1 [Micromonospora palythoicola]|uniref:effector-associated constant component EACC1 n=1 Tax=Micromonospora palythoicola TaxID=3120507 RepID=UPI002FCDEF26